MRPLHQTQEPHHFIKRWPRSRRDARPVPDRIEWVVVSEEDTDDIAFRALANRLKKAISDKCPKGWGTVLLTEPKLHFNDETVRNEVYQKVRFFKPV